MTTTLSRLTAAILLATLGLGACSSSGSSGGSSRLAAGAAPPERLGRSCC